MEVKFSHNYPKLWNQKQAELIAIRVLDAEAVQKNKDLIEYDTKFEIRKEFKYYILPSTGKLIQLIFMGDKDIPFCTLRSHNDEKFKYYQGNINKIFDIKIGD